MQDNQAADMREIVGEVYTLKLPEWVEEDGNFSTDFLGKAFRLEPYPVAQGFYQIFVEQLRAGDFLTLEPARHPLNGVVFQSLETAKTAVISSFKEFMRQHLKPAAAPTSFQVKDPGWVRDPDTGLFWVIVLGFRYEVVPRKDDDGSPVWVIGAYDYRTGESTTHFRVGIKFLDQQAAMDCVKAMIRDQINEVTEPLSSPTPPREQQKKGLPGNEDK